MPKCFKQLSLRQKNRRLKAYKTNKQQRIVNRSTISIKHNFESLAHTNIPIKQRVLSDDCNSDDLMYFLLIQIQPFQNLMLILFNRKMKQMPEKKFHFQISYVLGK